MTLDDFRALDNMYGDQHAARMDYVANVIIGQNPRLRRGDDMTGPVSSFKRGSVAGPEDGGIPQTALSLCVDPQDLFNFHPYLKIPQIGDWLHMYLVQETSPVFSGLHVGAEIDVEYSDGAGYLPKYKTKTFLTQDMIDATTKIMIRYCLS